MAQRTLDRLVPTSAFNLGVLRALVSGFFLLSILTTSFQALGRLPATILRPVGAMKLVPWDWYDFLLTPTAMEGFKWVLVFILLLSIVGFLTTWSTKASVLLVIFYQGLLRSFGHYNHDEMAAIYILLILAFTPCGDAFSVDGRSSKVRPEAGLKYGYPVLLMMILMAWVYFSSALIKLRVAGLEYLSPNNLPALAIYHSLDNLHDTHFKLAFWLPGFRSYLPFVTGLALVWELIFPLAIFWKRARWWILGGGIVFHLLTLFFMNIFFPFQLAMYVVFIDWSVVADRSAIVRRRLSSRSVELAATIYRMT